MLLSRLYVCMFCRLECIQCFIEKEEKGLKPPIIISRMDTTIIATKPLIGPTVRRPSTCDALTETRYVPVGVLVQWSRWMVKFTYGVETLTPACQIHFLLLTGMLAIGYSIKFEQIGMFYPLMCCGTSDSSECRNLPFLLSFHHRLFI